jgi:ATP-dependent Clp protease ATP-binding subunit ClpA
VLRPEVIGQIVTKFLAQLTASARAKGFELVTDEAEIISEVEGRLLGVGAQYGARQIRSPMLEQWVQVPLNRWILENSPAAGTRIRVYRTAGSPPFAVEALPGSFRPPDGIDLTMPPMDTDHATERNRP